MQSLYLCRKWDLNPHRETRLEPESSASAIPPFLLTWSHSNTKNNVRQAKLW